MRESERNVGRADNNLPGARSAAEGETQEPEKVIDPRAVEESERAGQESSWGAEGSAGAERKQHGSSLERKPNA